MFDKIKEVIDNVKGNKQPTQMDIINAKAALASARTKNLNVIDYQLITIDQNKNNALRKVQVENAKQSIKNAYYALSIIDVVEAKLEDAQVGNHLASGMNDIAKAMKLINHFNMRAEKPQIRLFNRQYKKLTGQEAKATANLSKMENAYTGAINNTIELDEMVDDDIVERLMMGEDPLTCLQTDTSIHAPYDYNTMEIDFSAIREDAGTYNYNMDFDFDNMNLDDLKD